MKKLITATIVSLSLATQAMAADLPASTYSKAPAAPLLVAPNWTGFYVFGGGGGGIWEADTTIKATVGGACLLCGTNQRQGGYGTVGNVGAGYDWQFNDRFLVGVFADGQFGSLKGTIQDQALAISGSEKMRAAWATGVRFGRVIAPNVLTYANVGYSGSNWSGATLLNSATGGPSGLHTDAFDRNGIFVGGGIEHNLDIFGITAPGWYMKTEYRSAYYGTKNISERIDGSNAFSGRDISFKPWTQTIMSSIVYRFNWTSPTLSKY